VATATTSAEAQATAKAASLEELRAALDEGDRSPVADGYSLQRVLGKLSANKPESDFGPVLHGYALIESVSQPGNFYAVHMSGVIAEKYELIGNGKDPTHPNFATQRLVNAAQIRRERRGWNKP